MIKRPAIDNFKILGSYLYTLSCHEYWLKGTLQKANADRNYLLNPTLQSIPTRSD